MSTSFCLARALLGLGQFDLHPTKPDKARTKTLTKSDVRFKYQLARLMGFSALFASIIFKKEIQCGLSRCYACQQQHSLGCRCFVDSGSGPVHFWSRLWRLSLPQQLALSWPFEDRANAGLRDRKKQKIEIQLYRVQSSLI